MTDYTSRGRPTFLGPMNRLAGTAASAVAVQSVENPPAVAHSHTVRNPMLFGQRCPLDGAPYEEIVGRIE